MYFKYFARWNSSPIALFLLCTLSGLISFSCHQNEKHAGQAEDAWAIGPFEKLDRFNPIMLPDTNQTFVCPIRDEMIRWEEKDVFNPSIVLKDDTVFMIYRAEDILGKYNGTSRLGLAYSTDAIHFSKYPEPVIYPENDAYKIYEWEGGIEDPRVVRTPDGSYLMTYTSYDGHVARLMLAQSPDLRSWKKFGPVLKGEHADTWSKSGSIVCDLAGGQFIARQIQGKYWMYFGDKNIHLAWSENLIDWIPLTNESGELVNIFGPREGFFDSDLVEPGPQAIMTSRGILLIYNGRNYGPGKTSLLPEGTYSGGQILFDSQDPAKILERCIDDFIRPDKPYETQGQVNQVVFLEGLALFQNSWWLYYGTADSKIAVARAPYDSGLFPKTNEMQ